MANTTVKVSFKLKQYAVTFTATAKTDYKVEKWTITGGTFVEGGSEGSPTAKVKITGEATVKV